MPAPYAAKLAAQQELLPPNQSEPAFDPKEYVGRVLVVCAGNAKKAETERWLSELAQTWREGLPPGVEVVWLAVGSGPEEVADVVRRLPLPFRAWPDPTGSSAERLNHRIDPSLYVIGKWGDVRYVGDWPGAQLGRMVDLLLKETEGSDRQFFTSRGVDVGHVAPEFSLSDLEGKPVSLAALLASARVLCLVFAGPELRRGSGATPALVRLREAFPEGQLAVALIYSSLALPEVRGAQGEASRIAILVDESGEVARMYQVEETPLCLLIGGRDIIRYRGTSLSDVANLAQGFLPGVRPSPPTGRDLLPP